MIHLSRCSSNARFGFNLTQLKTHITHLSYTVYLFFCRWKKHIMLNIICLLSEFASRGPTKSSTSCIHVARYRGRKGPKSQWKNSFRFHCARGGPLRPNPKTSSWSDGGSKGFRTRQGVLNPREQTVT